MGLNIKNPRVEQLARQLASATGETMTSAIQAALEEKLERLRRERDVAQKIKKIDEILTRSGPTPPGASSDHSHLYDKRGLPR
ncbi:PSK operon transcription factor [Nitratireductor sp. CAU 1489]|uniref:PSK operon transcription factor n=1 Tax=Nitratireductor arenosus TaxID=2682096 RepID=A0A844QE53_9HYPH|nr:type II toxin-antitoxin system VapB family antitoxin [Nitratireductor arenosus]MVA98266.1 PSK operon transcription factor [Nitratireductor arenosus]